MISTCGWIIKILWRGDKGQTDGYDVDVIIQFGKVRREYEEQNILLHKHDNSYINSRLFVHVP